MIEHLWDCLIIFAANPANVAISVVSLFFSLAAIYYIRSGSAKAKIFATYSHLAFLIFPAAFFVLSMTCNITGIPCDEAKSVLYSLLIAMGGSALFGTLLLPYIHRIGARKITLPPLLKAESEKNKIRMPSLYVSDSAIPRAFSHSSIFPEIYISVGLLELLGKKEIEAVLLHELGHLKNNSALLKFSLHFFNHSSPFSRITPITRILECEEAEADAFAASVQGTWKHLNRAKKKFLLYEKSKKASI